MTAERKEKTPRGVGVARVHAQMLLVRGLIATSFPVGAAITHGLEPAMLTLLRFVLASLLFAPFVAVRHGIALPTPRALAGYAAISACMVIFFWSMFEALRWTSALNAATLFTLVPGIAACYAAFLVRERLGSRRLAAIGLGLVGAVWVVFRGDPAALVSFAFNKGDLIFFGGCLVLGLYAPLVRRFNRGEPAAVMTFWVLLTGTGWLVLLNNTAIWTTDWSGIDLGVFAGIAYLAVFTTILSFFIQQHATLRIGPTRVTSYSYLNPALVVLIEWIAGKGLPPLIVLPGVAIILAATFVVQTGAGKDQDPRPTTT